MIMGRLVAAPGLAGFAATQEGKTTQTCQKQWCYRQAAQPAPHQRSQSQQRVVARNKRAGVASCEYVQFRIVAAGIDRHRIQGGPVQSDGTTVVHSPCHVHRHCRQIKPCQIKTELVRVGGLIWVCAHPEGGRGARMCFRFQARFIPLQTCTVP